MSWTIEERIGELRPWPESVKVVRGNSGEAMRYDRSERSGDGVDETCVPDDYTAKLMAELVQVMEERDTLRSKFEVSQDMRHAEYKRYARENAKLRELCRLFAEYADQDRCEGCCIKSPCRNGKIEECPLFTKIRELARELGIEVEA